MLPVSSLVAGRRRVWWPTFAFRWQMWGRTQELDASFPIPGNSGYLRHVAMSILSGPAAPRAISLKLAFSALIPQARNSIAAGSSEVLSWTASNRTGSACAPYMVFENGNPGPSVTQVSGCPILSLFWERVGTIICGTPRPAEERQGVARNCRYNSLWLKWVAITIF